MQAGLFAIEVDDIQVAVGADLIEPDQPDVIHGLEHRLEIVPVLGDGKDLVLTVKASPSIRPKSSAFTTIKGNSAWAKSPSLPHLALTAWNFLELPRLRDIILL